MRNIAEILSAAKTAFLNGEFEQTAALLVPLADEADAHIAGVSCYISGLAFVGLKNFPRAYEMFEKGIVLKYSDPNLYEGYGAQLQICAQYDEAERVYTAGIENCGRVSTLLSHWSTIELMRGNVSHSEELLKEALQKNDTDYMGWTNLGNLFQMKCHYRDAVFCYREALKVNPQYESAVSNLLLTSNYTRVSRAEVFEAHKKYASAVIPVSYKSSAWKSSDKIRIAFISGDFKTHSVAYFFAPILQYIDRSRFHITCFSDVYSPDPVTLRFAKQADVWHDSSRWSNEETAQIISSDSIDILIDLSGHCGGRRLSVLRAKPAPIQAAWIGYPNTSGVPEIDYRIVDEITDPADSDQFHTEKLIRLKSPFLCYMPALDLPEISELPQLTNGFTTFGSCNNLSKLSDETIEIWAKLMLSLPGSRLALKSKALKDSAATEETLSRFESAGLSKERISLEGHRSSNREHLTFYNDIDIALDCFPYNGTTTTCESLIMGVPVLTILGDRHADRVSASLLTAVGHSELIAESSVDFIKRGIDLASDSERLQGLRKMLRSDMKNSALADGNRICRELENAFGVMIANK